MPSENTKYVADKDTTNMLDLDFQDKVFKAKSDWFIYNETVYRKIIIIMANMMKQTLVLI